MKEFLSGLLNFVPVTIIVVWVAKELIDRMHHLSLRVGRLEAMRELDALLLETLALERKHGSGNRNPQEDKTSN